MENELYKKLNELKKVPEYIPNGWYIKRGFEFEKLLNELFEKDGLLPKSGYRPQGEQIDGSFIYGSEIFLFEAKWINKEICASEIYQFKGKVDGKLIGTKGIFISMSPYSRDSIDALSVGKSLNIILFDSDDIEEAIKSNSFSSILFTKLRHAAETGAVYFPFKGVSFSTHKPVKEVYTQELIISEIHDNLKPLLIICEGKQDQIILQYLINRILAENGIDRQITIIVAGGKFNVVNLINGLFSINEVNVKYIILADSDGYNFENWLHREINFSDYSLILPEPSIEIWFAEYVGSVAEQIKIFRHKNMTEKVKIVNSIDLKLLREKDESFSDFYDSILSK